MLESGFGGLGASINASIAIEEVHGVETKDCKMVGNSLYPKPSAKLEGVMLLLGNEAAPYITVRAQPLVGARIEDVVWEEIVVAEGGHDGNEELAIGVGKCFHELVSNLAVRG
jgi:hypothetical protein